MFCFVEIVYLFEMVWTVEIVQMVGVKIGVPRGGMGFKQECEFTTLLSNKPEADISWAWLISCHKTYFGEMDGHCMASGRAHCGDEI